jgi:hypothetical protein
MRRRALAAANTLVPSATSSYATDSTGSKSSCGSGARARRSGGLEASPRLSRVLVIADSSVVRFARHREERLEPSLHDLIQHRGLGFVTHVSLAKVRPFGNHVGCRTSHGPDAMAKRVPGSVRRDFGRLAVTVQGRKLRQITATW